MWKTLYKTARASLSELCFPSLCISCECKIEKGSLCSLCSEKIELISTKNRCHICFEENEGRCFRCAKETLFPRAVTCENFGPVQSLAKHLSSNEKIQKNIGSLMVVQLCSMNWPIPDVLIPIDEEAVCIARHIKPFFSSEICPILSSKDQALSRLIKETHFSIEKKVNLSDKSCLVVSLNRIKPETILEMGERLNETAPKGVFFLSFLS